MLQVLGSFSKVCFFVHTQEHNRIVIPMEFGYFASTGEYFPSHHSFKASLMEVRMPETNLDSFFVSSLSGCERCPKRFAFRTAVFLSRETYVLIP